MTAAGVRLATTGAALLVLVLGAGCSASTTKAGGEKARHARERRVLNTRALASKLMMPRPSISGWVFDVSRNS
jgi:hypothetical protein